MKKIGIVCTALLATLFLSGCNNLASQKTHKAANKVSVKKSSESKKNSDDDLMNIYDDSSQEEVSEMSDVNVPATSFSNVSPMRGQQPKSSKASTSYNGDPKAQAETAKLQHDWNVKQGIENPDGSETQNFQNWSAKRDQAEANGQTVPEYNQNTQW